MHGCIINILSLPFPSTCVSLAKICWINKLLSSTLFGYGFMASDMNYEEEKQYLCDIVILVRSIVILACDGDN